MSNTDVNTFGQGKRPESLQNKNEKQCFQSNDVQAAVLNGTLDELNADSSEARAVLRKIDLHLLPLLAFTYLIQV